MCRKIVATKMKMGGGGRSVLRSRDKIEDCLKTVNRLLSFYYQLRLSPTAVDFVSCARYVPLVKNLVFDV